MGKGWKHYADHNRHHWQAWVAVGNGGTLTPLDIPDKYIKEMVCDMIGASLAQGKGSDIKPFYLTNQASWILNAKTRTRFEELIGV